MRSSDFPPQFSCQPGNSGDQLGIALGQDTFSIVDVIFKPNPYIAPQ